MQNSLYFEAEPVRDYQVQGPRSEMYTVQAGDTLSGIAQRNNLTPAAVLLANARLQPWKMERGQVIKIPHHLQSVAAQGSFNESFAIFTAAHAVTPRSWQDMLGYENSESMVVDVTAMSDAIAYWRKRNGEEITADRKEVVAIFAQALQKAGLDPQLSRLAFVDEGLQTAEAVPAAVSQLQTLYRRFGDWGVVLHYYAAGDLLPSALFDGVHSYSAFLERMDEEVKKVAYVIKERLYVLHAVAPGETLGGLRRHYTVAPDQDITRPDGTQPQPASLRIGETLRVPVSEQARSEAYQQAMEPFIRCLDYLPVFIATLEEEVAKEDRVHLAQN